MQNAERRGRDLTSQFCILHFAFCIYCYLVHMVQVRNLVKHYGSIQAVRDVNLDVQAGEIFGLLGPNGAGKTTTLECILGLRLPDSGSITIDGIDAIAEPERIKQIIGAQLQATALQDKLTPREAIKFFGAFYRNSIKPDQLIKRFALEEKANAPFDSLSAGQKQRLALALAFVNDPRLIFLDEPTAGLDPQSRRELHEDILNLKADGRTILLTTHYIEEAQRLCDRIAIIQAGEIIETGTPNELIERANLPERVIVHTTPVIEIQKLNQLPAVASIVQINQSVEIATTDITNLVIAMVRLIESENAKLIDLQIHRPSLEDAFLKLAKRPEREMTPF
jgi:ABC-2 type transport system ATP-binding protein